MYNMYEAEESIFLRSKKWNNILKKFNYVSVKKAKARVKCYHYFKYE